jgi:glycosyltransferase involved in cell wall biosynthesis
MITGKNHIAFFCSRLDVPGGIERAIVNTANLFADNMHPVTLIILDNIDTSFYPIHPAVSIKQYPLLFGITEKGNKLSRKFQFIRDIKKLKTILKKLKADTIIATEYPFAIAAIMAGAKKYSKVYSWEHHHYDWLKKSFFWNFLFNSFYPKLKGIVCLNKTEAEHFKQYAPVYIIPNFIENKSSKKSTGNTKTILSVGWLIPRKGIDYIMQAAKIIFTKHPDWKWKIIGEGEMKNDLLNFIEKENMQGKLIVQQPLSSNIDDEYCSASLFVLASRFEAFPMVLLEAMSLGVPCISFDCLSGPSDIITNNENGILVEKENPQKLAEAIIKLIEDDSLRNKMGQQAFENVQRFSSGNIYKLWEEKILNTENTK